MGCRMTVAVMLIVLCLGTAVKADGPSRHLLLGYIPQGCSNLIVSVYAQESDPSWFQDAPEIRGKVTLSNPNTYNIPIDNVIVQARSSDGMLYSATADCDGSSSAVVPANPQPYSYGTVTCRYRISLDRNVFGSYGSDSNRRRLLGGLGYFPTPDQRPSWTVVAVATISYSNAQCLSAPTSVNTDCWWTWLEGWHRRHHHHLFGGRKLMQANTNSPKKALPSGAAGPWQASQVQQAAAITRHLLSSGLDNCHGLIQPTGYIQANVDGTNAVVGQVVLVNFSPVPLAVNAIKVTIGNNIAFTPLMLNADCHGATAVSAFGRITCNFAIDLPTAGKSASPGVWSSVVASAKVGSNVDCTSAVVTLVNTING